MMASSTAAAAPRLPEPPAGLAQLTVEDDSGRVEVVLEQVGCWPNRGVPLDLARQQDPVTTVFRPATERRSGAEACLWAGHRLSAHHAPGDTLVTYALLLEVAEGRAQGIWYEDHREVPRVLQVVRGSFEGLRLSLDAEPNELAPAARIEGVVWRR